MPRNEVRKSKKMPSIKKRVTGFIRQISGPSQVVRRINEVIFLDPDWDPPFLF
jgi:hypothetical protein